MAEISTIARPYATAIFNLAKENKSLSNWSNMLSLLSNVVADSQIKDFIADHKSFSILKNNIGVVSSPNIL